MFLLSFRRKRSDGRGPAPGIWVVRRAVQPFSSELTRLVSLAETVVRPSSRRVRLLALCSRRCRRLAFWRTIFPVPVRRNRFDAPLWVLALGIFPQFLGSFEFLGPRCPASGQLGEGLVSPAASISCAGPAPGSSGCRALARVFAPRCGARTIVMLRPSCLADVSTKPYS